MNVFALTGSFAGDKDTAAAMRDNQLRPALASGEDVSLDFEGVDLVTQSFIHALIASVVRENPKYLDHISFLNCNENIQSIIEIVVEYAQDEFE